MGLVQNALVPEARQDRRDGGLADLTTVPAAVRGDQVAECLDLLDHHDLIELLAAVREVLAEPIVDSSAHRLELRLEQLGHARQAAAAAGAGLGARLDRRDGRRASAPEPPRVIWPSATLLQEHTWAPWSSPGAGRAPADTSAAGGTVSGWPLLNRPSNVPNSEASPTRMPPRRRVPSRLKMSFL